MTPETLAALTSIPAALAVIVTVGMFLRHIAQQHTADRALWTNHLSQTVAALTQLTDEIRELRRERR